MARVSPFRPYRYSAKAGDLSDLVTQPYDKIPDELRDQYLAASPYNFVRLIKAETQPGNDEESVYQRAAALLDEWIADGILEQDPEDAFYAYFQEFDHPETAERTVRKGFIALVDVEDYEDGVIHRHELTHRGPKLDRMKLADATQAYFGQLFFLYDDPAQRIDALLDEASATPPLMEASEQRVVHRVWRVDGAERIAEIQQVMSDKKLLIADGHHRYETALAYARAHPENAGASRVMLTLVNMSSEGLVVLPTHRVISGLDDFSPATTLERLSSRFDPKPISDQDVRQALDDSPTSAAAIGVVLAGDPSAYLLTPKSGRLDDLLADVPGVERSLDVVVLHRALIGEALRITEEDVRELRGIRYIRGAANAVAQVRSGEAQAAFLLRPISAKDVAEVSFAGGVMPQKSTDFYPKLLSGFTTYRFGPPKAKEPTG